jgi:hypothetical protein
MYCLQELLPCKHLHIERKEPMTETPETPETGVVSTRMGIELRGRIKAAAEQAGVTVSDWMQQAAVEMLASDLMDWSTAHAPTRHLATAPVPKKPTRPKGKAEPKSEACSHPMGRRVGDTCMVCLSTVATGKKNRR